MKVIIAPNSGFCFGVKRAVDAALTQRDSYTLGPLIHNPQTIEQLKERGIKAIDSIDDIDKGTLLIRTHGVPGQIIEKSKNKGLEVIDLTCPFVKKAQDVAIKAEKEGYKVVVIGDKQHPEVKGITGNLSNYEIIESPDQVKKHYDKIWVVVQTTQLEDNFKAILSELNGKAKEIKVTKTICNATEERQMNARKLANNADMMIVVGGKNSANTNKLAFLCKGIIDTKHIESDEELKPEWFRHKKTVGITAGASTPHWLIKKIANRIENEF